MNALFTQLHNVQCTTQVFVMDVEDLRISAYMLIEKFEQFVGIEVQYCNMHTEKPPNHGLGNKTLFGISY